MDERLTKRNYKALKTREILVCAGLQLINEQGYEQVSVDDICRSCGVSKGAFYYHFRSKADLLYQLRQSGLQEEPVREEGDVVARLRREVEQHIRNLQEDGVGIVAQRTVHAMAGSYDTPSEELSAEHWRRRRYQEILRQGIEDGALSKRLPVDKTVDLIMVFQFGIVIEWCMHRGAYSLQEKAEGLYETFFNGLLGEYLQK